MPSHGVGRSWLWDSGVWPHLAMAGRDGWHLIGEFLHRVLKNRGAGDLGQNLKSDGGSAIHHGHAACSCSVPVALLHLPPVPTENHHPTYKTLPWPAKGLLGQPHHPTGQWLIHHLWQTRTTKLVGFHLQITLHSSGLQEKRDLLLPFKADWQSPRSLVLQRTRMDTAVDLEKREMFVCGSSKRNTTHTTRTTCIHNPSTRPQQGHWEPPGISLQETWVWMNKLISARSPWGMVLQQLSGALLTVTDHLHSRQRHPGFPRAGTSIADMDGVVLPAW